MRKLCDVLIVTLLVFLVWFITGWDFSWAESPPEIVIIEIVPTPTPVMVTPTPAPPATATPEPTAEPEIAYHAYSWPNSTIDIFAAIYWAECNTDAEKLAVTALIFNRVKYGKPFAGTAEAAARQRGEFNRGHISDRNRALARVNLNKCRTQEGGEYAGIDVPYSAIYMARANGALIMYNDQWQQVWPKGA